MNPSLREKNTIYVPTKINKLINRCAGCSDVCRGVLETVLQAVNIQYLQDK